MSSASKAEIYKPYFQSNPNKIEFYKGYCINQSEEIRLWEAIYKFSSSALEEIPSIPPEQINYIEKELASNNLNRTNSIRQNPFYIMKDILTQIENLQKHSEQYKRYQNILPLHKKVEFIGRALINLKMPIDFDAAERLAFDLKSKGYLITKDQLQSVVNTPYFLSENLVMTLICYGENNISK